MCIREIKGHRRGGTQVFQIADAEYSAHRAGPFSTILLRTECSQRAFACA